MQIEFVKIKAFRNLSNFEIDFSQMKTVLIGQNASGKSNFLEAIVLIFKQLDYLDDDIKEEFFFEYEIVYRCYKEKIKIIRKRDEQGKIKYSFLKFNGNKNAFEEDIYMDIPKFKENKDKYLPKYIFAYYSGLGNSNRLEEHFEKHKEDFARRAMKRKDNNVPEPPRMFYCELIHSQLSLLSFFIDNAPDALAFLKENLGIDAFQSILLTIQQPDWSDAAKKKEDPKSFGSTGVVKNLIHYLYNNVAFAPMRDTVKLKARLWEKKAHKTGVDVVHLYINDFKKISEYVKENKWDGFKFFHTLNTAYVSQLLTKEGIKVRVKKTYADRILFKDLSEGEQQLLTVLGLMRFTHTEEALFILDEPDTHLNPLWRWKYMEFIDKIVLKKKNEGGEDIKPSIQVIMSSHDPLSIGSLTKEEVRVFYTENDNGKIKVTLPENDPKGLGVEGILTEIFGLPTILDIPTKNKLEKRDSLYNKKHFGKGLSSEEEIEYNQICKELEYVGIKMTDSDPIYQQFWKAYYNHFKDKENKQILSPEEIAARNKAAEDILKSLLENDN